MYCDNGTWIKTNVVKDEDEATTASTPISLPGTAVSEDSDGGSSCHDEFMDFDMNSEENNMDPVSCKKS